ncbi:MAG: HAMP domain-containing histidine kinase [Clostridia bacterium]|nr:HAMP domain-containing histidine kinase [Clostridia bacterium]
MKQKSKQGVKLKIWEYFSLFSVFLLVLIWILQTAFLQYTYIGTMAKETLTNARELVSLHQQDRLNEETVKNKAFHDNVAIIITDEENTILSAHDSMGEMTPDRVKKFEAYSDSIGNVIEMLNKSEKKEVYFRLEGERIKNKNNVFLYAAHSVDSDADGVYIYVLAQLEPIDSVVTVIRKQFVSITIIVLIFSAAIAYGIARRFSRPVEKLTASARELALGNLNVDFTTEGAINEIGELSNALAYASEEISKSAQFRRELMANVSHDLRTPLTMIKMYAEMIRDISGDNKEKREKNLQIIIDETDRLSLLVNDILELSREENVREELEIRPFNISKTTTKILERFSGLTQEGYIFELEAPQEAYVFGDEARIEQVLYNLLSNAINYTGEDKKVQVRITKKFDSVKVEVIDTGAGISKEEIPNVWDRYYRSKTHIRSKVGTGLGLSIVKTILVKHSADFGIESTVGVGSNFWFELKLPENSTNKVLRLADNNIVSED